ncbi:MAG: hypothetical protein EAZ09_01555 [Oscillatoriales cyanobacterium]|nr:MAG: hypothetical protein EAZ18_21600 [Oscillatoriales cyanobacterium]TAH25840.1 MAG: hypothetical protein EAZ09_01555 [Oscillatoriales cyanobacterium]
MSDKNRINRVLKALQDGTESVRQNPSEGNYQTVLFKIQKAGKKTNFWGKGIAVTFLALVGFFLIGRYIQPPQQSISHKKTTQTNSLNYSLTYCGDKTAGGTNTWYPVYIAYSPENLKIIHQSFCCNAFYDSSLNLIQVASFYNRSKADQLVAALKSRNLKSISIGEGQIVTTSPSHSRNNCR